MQVFSVSIRRSSDRRAQIEADLDDVLAAFDLLDSKALIPPILNFCEASELYRLPSLSLDPVSEQVQDNTKALLSLTSVVNSIEKKTSSFFETSASTFPPQNNTRVSGTSLLLCCCYRGGTCRITPPKSS